MQISEFTRSKLDYLEIMCNFTPEEQQLFNIRAEGKTLEEAAEIMSRSVDSVKTLSRKINKKIQEEL